MSDTAAMQPTSPPPRSTSPAAGGCLIALGMVAAVIYGTFRGHMILALLIGIAVGSLAALGVFVADRRR